MVEMRANHCESRSIPEVTSRFFIPGICNANCDDQVPHRSTDLSEIDQRRGRLRVRKLHDQESLYVRGRPPVPPQLGAPTGVSRLSGLDRRTQARDVVGRTGVLDGEISISRTISMSSAQATTRHFLQRGFDPIICQALFQGLHDANEKLQQ